jgi:hypothetical protein
MNKLLNKLNINETFTKKPRKDNKKTKLSDVITPIEDYNYMADLLYLPNDNGYKYLLVVCDLVTREFDIEQIKNKEQKTVLNAMKKIIKRPYLNIPYATMKTDNGTEFNDNDVYHSISKPYRHSQMSMVESLNKTLGRLIHGYLNSIEERTHKEYNHWVEIVPTIRKELNKIRYIKAPYTEKTIYDKIDTVIDMNKQPKFKVGDLVHYALDYPENALGNKQNTANFRMGDYRWSKQPKKIIKIMYMNGQIPYRYVLNDPYHVSYTENQLMKSDEDNEKWIVEKILDKKKLNNKVYYLVKWKGYNIKDATWESYKELVKDGLKKMINDYNSHL